MTADGDPMTESANNFRSALGLLALQQMPRVGPTTALRAALRAAPPSAVVADWEARLAPALDWARQVVRQHVEAGVSVIDFFDEQYPRLLSQISDPPPVIYVRGNLELLRNDRFIAVVGTREPSRFGESAATEITARVAASGWGVVSGLAVGIDTIAHRAALAHGAPTIAVLGNGLDRTYPKVNSELSEAILEAGGAILSELPFGAPPIPRNLIARDRLQSAMSAAVVVAQTGIKGGAMHTARFAVEQGRPLYCPVPHGENGKSEGLRVLLEHPGSDLPAVLPAWRDAKSLSNRLGSRPVARPIERHSMDDFVESLERHLDEAADDSQAALVIPGLEA